MTVEPPKTAKGEATRDAIIRMAFAQALELGFEGISVGTLAESLGLSKSGLFAHFKSKEALQLAVLDEAIERFAERVVAPALIQPRGEPRLRALFENKLRWLESNGAGIGCLFTVLASEYDDRPGVIRERLVRARLDWRAVLARAVALAVREHHLDPDTEPEQLAFELVGIDAAFHETRKLLGDLGARDRAVRAFDRLVDGARPRTRPRRA